MTSPDGESWREIRPHVLGVARRDRRGEPDPEGEQLLVARYEDPAAGPFYRPPGGGIEFGEPSAAALVREFDEEFGRRVEVGPLLGVVENVFEFDGTPGHEVNFVYGVAFDGRSVYERDRLTVSPEGEEADFVAEWHALEAFGSGRPPLYPEGLSDLLRGETRHLVSRDDVDDAGNEQ